MMTGRICGANEPFLLHDRRRRRTRWSSVGLIEFLEAASAEHKSYGDGVGLSLRSMRKGDRWLRPKRGRGQVGRRGDVRRT